MWTCPGPSPASGPPSANWPTSTRLGCRGSSRPGTVARSAAWPDLDRGSPPLGGRFSEVDDDLAVHVAARLELDRLADLFDREVRRDRHPQPPRRHQAGDLLDGTR